MSVWRSTLEEHKERQRDHIIDAAVKVIVDRGAGNFSMSALAKEAGISRQTLYNYFHDLDTILVAYVERQAVREEAGLRASLETVEGPSEKLDVFVRSIVRHLVQQRHGLDLRAIMGPGFGDHGDDHADQVVELLSKILRNGVDAAVFREEIGEPEIPSMLILMLGSLQPLVAHGADVDRIEERSVDFVRRIVAP